MLKIKYFAHFVTESLSNDPWLLNWKNLPEWELLTIMGFVEAQYNEKALKPKIYIEHPNFSQGILALTKGGYIRRPWVTSGYVFAFPKESTPIKKMLDHVIKRYASKIIPSIPTGILDNFFTRHPDLIDVLYGLPKIQEGIIKRTGIVDTAGNIKKAAGINNQTSKWLDSSCQSWTINQQTGLIDVENFLPKKDPYGKKGKGLRGLKFGEAKGSFTCEGLNLDSLDGCPSVVEKDFNCSGNKISSLSGGPIKVGGSYNCSSNKNLVSLAGSPSRIEGHLDAEFCEELTNLGGTTDYIGGNLLLSGCSSLKSLEGCPPTIMKDVDVEWNVNLEDVIGPKHIGGKFIYGTRQNKIEIKWDSKGFAEGFKTYPGLFGPLIDNPDILEPLLRNDTGLLLKIYPKLSSQTKQELDKRLGTSGEDIQSLRNLDDLGFF
jgi:hypothetical protein